MQLQNVSVQGWNSKIRKSAKSQKDPTNVAKAFNLDPTRSKNKHDKFLHQKTSAFLIIEPRNKSS